MPIPSRAASCARLGGELGLLFAQSFEVSLTLLDPLRQAALEPQGEAVA